MKWLLILLLVLCISCKKEKLEATDQCIHERIEDSTVAIATEQFIAGFSNLANASGYQYDAKDDRGNQLDGIKVIEYAHNLFVGAYHTFKDNRFVVNIATSENLTDWKFRTQLAANASQPYVFAGENNEIYVAWEQEPDNHLMIALYQNIDSLIKNIPTKTKVLPQTLSTHAEGTPSIVAVSEEQIFIRFHYFFEGKRDLNAIGMLTRWEQWETRPDHCLNESIAAFGLKGNIGDRDEFLFKNEPFMIIEGQKTFNNFGTWQCYLYHNGNNKAWHIPFKTHHRSVNFANPTVSVLNVNSRDVLFFSLFIPSEKATPNEKGTFIGFYYL
jgi:hypothetical protein